MACVDSPDSQPKQQGQQGQRSRIVAASPPAPAIAPRLSQPKSQPPKQAQQAQPATTQQQSNDDVVRSTGSMALATLISRLTGFLRNAAIGATMGGAVASAFNTANTLPNLITEIVLGAVLTSLVVPVLVRAEKEDADKGAAFIRRLFTLAASLLVVVTVVSVAAAPILTRIQLNDEGKVNVVQSTSFAFLLLPQIFFYGIFSLFMAVLNTKGIFKPGAWAPVVNNVIALGTLVLYWTVPGKLDPSSPSGITDPHVLLLGVGTTLGVVMQALIMLPYLKKAGINLRPLWGIDDRLKQFGGMALAIIVYVGISQAGYMVTTRIASTADANAPNIYQQAWLLLQVPYGIIGVTLLTAIMPRLSRRAADGDDRGVVADLTMATKLTFLALLPIITFFMVFGTHVANALFAYGDFPPELANILGWTLSFSAFTLIPYALVLLHLRVFYAREEAWTPTFIIGGITATKILLSLLAPALATTPERVVVLLGAANGFGFVAGAVIGIFLLRRHLGSLQGPEVVRSAAWVLAASAPGALVAWLIDVLLGRIAGPLWDSVGSFGFLIRTALAGIIFLAITAVLLTRTPLEEVKSFVDLVKRKLGRGSSLDAADVRHSLAPTEVAPIPAPMSAGLVQPPRLVPGAPVLDGRFRLLVDCGTSETPQARARFWHAKDFMTGKDVALTFVDTASDNLAASAGLAAEVTRRTRLLAEKHLSVLPANTTIAAYRSGCLVISDWTPGSSVDAIAKAGPITAEAATHSFGALAEAAEAQQLGVHAAEQVRIDTSGSAILAFPAVLPGAGDEGIAEALHKLCPSAELRSVEKHEPVTLPVATEPVPHPAARAGFGAKGYSKTMTGLLIGISVGIVALIALLTSYLMGIFGQDLPDSPVRKETITVENSVPAAPTP